MNRKIFPMLLLCFVLMLSACGQGSDAGSQGNNATAPQTNENSDVDNSYVNNKEMTLTFSFGTKTGTYSGPVNKDGLPEGKGAFTSKNSEGESWTYTGDFVNGHFEGEGEASWPEANYKEIGQYHNDVIQPIDTSLVPRVYQSPDDYLFCCIEVSGRVYNVVDKNTFQMYEDVEAIGGNNNTVVHYDSTDYIVKEGDYVRVKAIVCGEVQYQNILGNTLTALELNAKEVQETTYIEAAYPTIRSIAFQEIQVQNGYKITIEKIEFAEKETRVYFSVENGGKSKISIYSWDIEAEQDNRQYEAQTRFETDYPNLPDGIRVGNIAEGIISFPPLAQSDFKVYIKISSEDWTEQIEEMAFSLSVPPID